ncbi:ABC transporter permease [Propioniferax innocua]
MQYLTYIRKMAVGDFGTSPRTGEPVLATFLDRFPATIELAVMALLFAIIVGIPLGYIAAKRAGGFLDVFAVGTSLMGVVVPVFVLAYLLKLVFAVGVPGLDFLAVLPTSGRQEVRIDATHVTGFFVLDGLLTGELDASWNAIKHLILPALALGSIPLAAITRMTRASVLEVLGEDYIRTATAKGLKQIIITWRHVMKNAMMPVLTTIGILTGQLLAGAVLTETVFAFNGIGSYLFQAINTLDYAVLQGFILLIALIYAVVNLVVDLLYGVIDPRMRVR